MEAKIAVLEDEKALSQMVQIILEKEGITQIEVFDTLAKLAQSPQRNQFDFYLLDIMLPDGESHALANDIRQHTDAPIFFLTAKTTDADKLIGFMNGADDYITKPFNPLELVARVKVQLQRYLKQKQAAPMHQIYSCPCFLFDYDAATLTVDGQTEILTGRLYNLLKYLCDNAGIVLSKEQIYEHVWGDPLFDDNTVMVHIRKLREKVESEPSKPHCIVTVRGIGYKLQMGD